WRQPRGVATTGFQLSHRSLPELQRRVLARSRITQMNGILRLERPHSVIGRDQTYNMVEVVAVQIVGRHRPRSNRHAVNLDVRGAARRFVGDRLPPWSGRAEVVNAEIVVVKTHFELQLSAHNRASSSRCSQSL